MTTHAVIAEDLRALAETVPFDAATIRLLEAAADALDPDLSDMCGHQAKTLSGRVITCDLPVDHEPWNHHQKSGGAMWDDQGRFL